MHQTTFRGAEGESGMGHVGYHFLAFLLALAAGLGALLHVLIVWELLTFLRTQVASVDAGLADDGCKGTAAGDDGSGCGTDRRAVEAGSQRLGMLLPASLQLLRAVGCAAFALARAIRTFLRTLFHRPMDMGPSVAPRLLGSSHALQGPECGCCQTGDGELSSPDHGNTSGKKEPKNGSHHPIVSKWRTIRNECHFGRANIS
jgi:hypothetical protein